MLHLSCMEALAWEQSAILAYLWLFWPTDHFAEGGEMGAQVEYTQMCYSPGNPTVTTEQLQSQQLQ